LLDPPDCHTFSTRFSSGARDEQLTLGADWKRICFSSLAEGKIKVLKGLALVALVALVVAPASLASAHCRSARNICDLGYNVCWGNDTIRAELNRVVPIPDGDAIGAALSACSHARWNHGPDNINDDGNGCLRDDWIVIGQAILQRAGGNAGACNQLPE
jgi:hypothetical protein